MKALNRKLVAGDDALRGMATASLSPEFLLASSPPPPPTNTTSPARKPFKPNSAFDSSMALTVLVLLTALFFMGFFSVYIQRCAEESPVEISRRRRQQRRTSPSSTQSGASFHGLDPSIVGSLPSFAYENKNAKEAVDCVVCISEFEEKETVKVIPYCGHLFHPECIDMWLFSHASCPLCRSTQLFPLPSASEKKKDACFNEIIDQGVCESPETLTVENGDTSADRANEIPFGSGRSPSCSSLAERVACDGSSS